MMTPEEAFAIVARGIGLAPCRRCDRLFADHLLHSGLRDGDLPAKTPCFVLAEPGTEGTEIRGAICPGGGMTITGLSHAGELAAQRRASMRRHPAGEEEGR